MSGIYIYVLTHIHTHTHTRTHTNTPTHKHRHTHACSYVDNRVNKHTYITYKYMCIHTVRSCTNAYMHTCTDTYIHIGTYGMLYGARAHT